MERSLRKNISQIIEKNNIKPNGIKESDLISLALYKTFRKEYFSNNYKNTFIVKDVDDNLWLTTGFMSEIDVYGLSGVVSSPDKELDFDSQYVFDEGFHKYLNGDDFKSIQNIYNVFSKSKSIDEISNKITEIYEYNMDSLYLFKSLFHYEVANSDLYQNIMKDIVLDSDTSEKYKLNIPCSVKGELKKKLFSGEILNNDNFISKQEEFVNKFENKTSFKNLDILFNNNKQQIDFIIKELDNLHPELNKKDKNIDLDFYIIETKGYSGNSYSSHFLQAENKEKKLIKNLNGFKDFYKEDKSFIDFIYENPFNFSDYNRSKTNLIEGLEYLTDDLLKPFNYSSQVFLIAKTKKGETVGMLSLDKKGEHKYLHKITGVSVKNSFRNQGVAEILYNKLAEVSINNNLIIHNNNYSPTGAKYLPKMKLRVLENNPNFVLIDEKLHNSIPKKTVNDSIESYNKEILSFIKKSDLNNNCDIKKLMKAYLSGKNHILKELNKSDNKNSYELYEEGIKQFSKTLEKKQKNKYKI